MKHYTTLTFILLVTISLSSCDSFTEVDAPQTQITSSAIFEEKSSANAALADIYSRIREEGVVTGNSGCNNFHTTCILKNNQIKFNALVSTRMACPGDGESVFFSALATADNYRFVQDLLELRKGEVVVIRFHRRH